MITAQFLLWVSSLSLPPSLTLVQTVALSWVRFMDAVLGSGLSLSTSTLPVQGLQHDVLASRLHGLLSPPSSTGCLHLSIWAFPSPRSQDRAHPPPLPDEMHFLPFHPVWTPWRHLNCIYISHYAKDITCVFLIECSKQFVILILNVRKLRFRRLECSPSF